MEENRIDKKLFNAKPDGGRRRGRPKLRWMDGIEIYENLVFVDGEGRLKIDRN